MFLLSYWRRKAHQCGHIFSLLLICCTLLLLLLLLLVLCFVIPPTLWQQLNNSSPSLSASEALWPTPSKSLVNSSRQSVLRACGHVTLNIMWNGLIFVLAINCGMQIKVVRGKWWIRVHALNFGLRMYVSAMDCSKVAKGLLTTRAGLRWRMWVFRKKISKRTSI